MLIPHKDAQISKLVGTDLSHRYLYKPDGHDLMRFEQNDLRCHCPVRFLGEVRHGRNRQSGPHEHVVRPYVAVRYTESVYKRHNRCYTVDNRIIDSLVNGSDRDAPMGHDRKFRHSNADPIKENLTESRDVETPRQTGIT